MVKNKVTSRTLACGGDDAIIPNCQKGDGVMRVGHCHDVIVRWAGARCTNHAVLQWSATPDCSVARANARWVGRARARGHVVQCSRWAHSHCIARSLHTARGWASPLAYNYEAICPNVCLLCTISKVAMPTLGSTLAHQWAPTRVPSSGDIGDGVTWTGRGTCRRANP